MLTRFVITLLTIIPGGFSTYHVDHEAPIFGPLVYLMDWKYSDVAQECSFLQGHGFGAVVVSPPTEHVASSPNSPWHERYEIVSYEMKSRSGNAANFYSMVSTCKSKSIKVIVDIVLNNMASTNRGELTGTGGSKANPKNYVYPNFKKSDGHFHDPCQGIDYKDPKQVRECDVMGLADLNLKHPHVRKEQVKLLNSIIIDGVVGFFVDKARFMWPWELAVRQTRLIDVYPYSSSRPYMLFNVQGNDREAGKYGEYVDLGRVTDYNYGSQIAQWFTKGTTFVDVIKQNKLFPDLIPSEQALVFLTNVNTHMDSQRTDVLRYNENPDVYKLATAFMLAYNHGLPLVMSTYKMNQPYNNAGPPTNTQGDIVSPGNDCKGGWNCEHRLPEVYKMALFNNDCLGQDVRQHVEGSSPGQFAFARGTRGFVAFNLGKTLWSQTFTTNLPAGEYCEVITGGVWRVGSKYCRKDAKKIKVDSAGSFLMEVPGMSVRAIHVWNMLGYRINKNEDEPRIPFYEITGFFNSLLSWFSTSGTAPFIPTAAPAAGGPPSSSAAAGGSADGLPQPGALHVRPNGGAL